MSEAMFGCIRGSPTPGASPLLGHHRLKSDTLMTERSQFSKLMPIRFWKDSQGQTNSNFGGTQIGLEFFAHTESRRQKVTFLGQIGPEWRAGPEIVPSEKELNGHHHAVAEKPDGA
jgi:hypothetical protein